MRGSTLRRPCTLYLSLELLEQDNYHLSRGWLYGNKYDHVSAESSETGKVNRVLGGITEDPNYVVQNEVVFRDCVGLRNHLAAVALPLDKERSTSGT